MKLEIKGLTKKYGDKIAVNALSYTFDEGIYGILGENGAGKTTLIKSICQLISYDGNIAFSIDGKKITKRKMLEYIGYVPQIQDLYNEFTVYQFMAYMAVLKNKKSIKKEIEEILTLVELLDYKNKKIESLSMGMKKRLLIAQALIGSPKILIMDEPTAGLDPEQRIQIRNILSRFSKDCIILIATHVVEDVEKLAREILILKSGNIVKSGLPQTICDLVFGKVKSVNSSSDITDETEKMGFITNIYYDGSTYNIRYISHQQEEDTGVNCYPTLEEAYLYYMKYYENDKI